MPARRVFSKVEFLISVPSTQRRVTAREGNPPLVILFRLESRRSTEVVQWGGKMLAAQLDAEAKTMNHEGHQVPRRRFICGRS